MKFYFCVLLVSIFGTTACVQTRGPTAEQLAQQRAAQERQQQMQIAEHRQRMQMQLEDADTRLLDSQQQIKELRTELANRPSDEEFRALENRIAAMEQMMQRMELQRAKDREEVIEILSQRMATVMAQQQSARIQASGRSHEVARGETLSAIAAAYRVSSKSIIDANDIRNPDNLRVGQKLIIPGS